MAAPATCPVALRARIRRCRFAHPLPIEKVPFVERGNAMPGISTRVKSARRCIGLDVHREFAQVAIWQDGQVSQAGRFATTPEQVRAFADGLSRYDEVALEATGNTWAIATLLAGHAGRVVVSNPVKTRAIAEARVKTDKVDAQILASLLAADFLPPVWRRNGGQSCDRHRLAPRSSRSTPARSAIERNPSSLPTQCHRTSRTSCTTNLPERHRRTPDRTT
jgi:Transposase